MFLTSASHWLNTISDCVSDAEKFYLKIHILSPASTSFLTTGTTVWSESFHALLIELLKEKDTLR